MSLSKPIALSVFRTLESVENGNEFSGEEKEQINQPGNENRTPPLVYKYSRSGHHDNGVLVFHEEGRLEKKKSLESKKLESLVGMESVSDV